MKLPIQYVLTFKVLGEETVHIDKKKTYVVILKEGRLGTQRRAHQGQFWMLSESPPNGPGAGWVVTEDSYRTNSIMCQCTGLWASWVLLRKWKGLEDGLLIENQIKRLSPIYKWPHRQSYGLKLTFAPWVREWFCWVSGREWFYWRHICIVTFGVSSDCKTQYFLGKWCSS